MNFLHKKSGNTYMLVFDNIINATNENEGQTMVLYTNGEKLFVREIKEFYEKFEEVP